jgi:hypothetical protein
MNHIIITLDGGLIQDIEGIPPNYKVIVIDCDTDGADEDELTTFKVDFNPPNSNVRDGTWTKKDLAESQAYVSVWEHKGDGTLPREISTTDVAWRYKDLIHQLP